MLNFFPTPYPDELWYSVICRYHIRSGNNKNQTTKIELFNGRNCSSLGIFFPNNTIYHIINQLPQDLFDVKKIILNHTLIRYYLRMYPNNKKEEFLSGLCHGTAMVPTNIWKITETNIPIFKYCPICVKEDEEYLGEPYWHREHQLPLMKVCLKHKCRLHEHTCGRKGEANERFIHLRQCGINSELNYEISDMDMRISKLSHEYLVMPFDIGPTSGYNNLSQDLYNKGYGTAKSFFSLNFYKIYNDLIETFGKDMINICFGNKTAVATINKIKNWSLMSPEKYILLSALIGQDAGTTFSVEKIDDEMKLKLLSLKKSGVIFKKKYVAEQLDINPVQLDAAATRLGIEPFWKEHGVYISEKRRLPVKTYLNEHEKSVIDKYVKDKNFANTSDFVKYCIDFVMNEDLP